MAGYFSYQYPLRISICPRECRANSGSGVWARVEEMFPQVKRATIAEWWVHNRPHASGHQLHFDSDETRIEEGGKPRHQLLMHTVPRGKRKDRWSHTSDEPNSRRAALRAKDGCVFTEMAGSWPLMRSICMESSQDTDPTRPGQEEANLHEWASGTILKQRIGELITLDRDSPGRVWIELLLA